MKNAVLYQNTWLMKTSQAYFLLELWQKFGKPQDKQNFEDHMKVVNNNYRKSSGLK